MESSSHGRYEFIDHTADIVIKAYGNTVEDAFACAAKAMFDIMTDSSKIEPSEKVEFETESVDREGLLVGFLSNLIVLHEVNEFVLTDFNIELVSARKLRVTALGERFDGGKHSHGLHIKGVSYHMMEIFDGDEGSPCHVQVLFDV